MLQKDITKDMKLVNKIFNNIVEDNRKLNEVGSTYVGNTINTVSDYKEMLRVKSLSKEDYQNERIEYLLKMIKVHNETGFNPLPNKNEISCSCEETKLCK